MSLSRSFGAPWRAILLATAVVATAVPVARAAAPDSSEKKPYVVLLKDKSANAKGVAGEHSRRFGVKVKMVYDRGLRGYAGWMTDDDAKRLAREPGVVVAPDTEVTAFGVTSQPTGSTSYGSPPLWGLDRIDEHQRSVPAENLYHYAATGFGVTAYVIDSGVRTGHNEFESRAKVGFDAFGGNGQDCYGHGTHVAGILGGKTFGVAKQVRIVSVKVLDCTGRGTTSNVVAGINWVTGNHAAGQPAVANMSLGGSANAAIDQAVAQSIGDGITYSIAAGNGDIIFGNGVDACNTSPARVPAALTTGATDNTDKKTSFSNYGTCVDVFAPGNNIPSAWGSTADPNAWQSVSGTSMAAPAVGGVAALFLELVPGATPGQVSQTITGMATPNVVTSSNTTGAKLLFAPWGDTDVNAAKVKLNQPAGPPPPPPPPPSCFLICLS